MPCNFLSIARAKIDAKYGAELLANADGLAVFANALAPLMGRVPEIVREPGGSVLLKGDRTNLRITADAVQAVNVWTSKDEMARLVETATKLAAQIAIPLATERTVKGLAKRYGQYAIQSDQRVGPARVVKLKIPLN